MIGVAVPMTAESPELGSGNGNFSQEFPTSRLYAEELLSPIVRFGFCQRL